jgi:hypothetical protein
LAIRAVVLRRMKARTVCKTTVNKFTKLRISQAYIQLLSIPENAGGAKMVSLLWVENREIRMFEPTEDYSADAPLFWLELFDHDRQNSLDSCNCHDIDSGVLSFEILVGQAAFFDKSLPEQGSEN